MGQREDEADDHWAEFGSDGDRDPADFDETAPIPSVQEGKPAALWEWWASRNEEDYTVGPCGSREEAVERGQEDYDGETFHIVEARKGSMARWLPKAERIIDIMSEASDDDCVFGENDYCELVGSADAIAAAEADLDALLSDWFDRHAAIFPTPWAFFATRNGEWIAALSPVGDEADADSVGKSPLEGDLDQALPLVSE